MKPDAFPFLSKIIVQLILVFLVVLVPAERTFGQASETTKAETNEDVVICSHTVVLVKISVTVTGKDGKEILNLGRQDVSIYEDGVWQEIEFFKLNDDAKATATGYRYALTYYPINQAYDGKYRKIRVVVKTKDGQRPKIRYSDKGYFARNPQP